MGIFVKYATITIYKPPTLGNHPCPSGWGWSVQVLPCHHAESRRWRLPLGRCNQTTSHLRRHEKRRSSWEDMKNLMNIFAWTLVPLNLPMIFTGKNPMKICGFAFPKLDFHGRFFIVCSFTRGIPKAIGRQVGQKQNDEIHWIEHTEWRCEWTSYGPLMEHSWWSWNWHQVAKHGHLMLGLMDSSIDGKSWNI